MTERLVRANGVDLCVETFGEPGSPAVLLVMGAAASMLHWPERFCRALADEGRYVVRYDHRDTGRSTGYPRGAPRYGLGDLVADAAALADEMGLRPVHVVGMSMGGMIAQLLALDHPGLVATLTLYESTPGSPGGETDDLPGPTLRGVPPADPDWRDRASVAAWIVEEERRLAGSHGFDEGEWRERAGRIAARAVDPAAAENHYTLGGHERWRARLGEIRVPTLVLHGTDDPMFPLPHGEALAGEIPGARLVVLPGVGHEPPPASVQAVIVDAIARHTA